MTSESAFHSVEPAGTEPSGDRRPKTVTDDCLDDQTARRILDTIRASKKFIDEAELAKQCRAVLEFYFSRGEHSMVVEACSLIDTGSRTARDDYLLSSSYISSGDFEKARGVISTAAWKGGRDWQLTALGKLLAEQGRKQEARAHFEEALKSNIFNGEALNELTAGWPDDEFTVRARGEVLRLQGNSAEAASAFMQLLDNGNEEPEVLKSAGIALADSRQYDKAENLLQKAVVTGGDAGADIALGIVQLERNETEAGIESIERGISKGAERTLELLRKLIAAYIKTGQNQRGEEVLDYLLKNEASEGLPRKELMQSMLKACRECKNHGMVLSIYDRTQPNERGQELKVLRLEALTAQGRYTDALEALEEASDLSNKEERRMVLLRKSGRLDEASALANEVLRKDRKNHEAAYTAIYTAYRSGAPREQLKRFRSLVLGSGNRDLLLLYLESAKRCREDLLVVQAAQSLISTGHSTVEILGDRATAVERLGRVSQSARLLKKLHGRERGVASLELLTAFYARHGRFAEEEAALEEAQSTMHLPIALLERLAKLKMDRGEVESAVGIIASAMENGESADGRYLQAQVLLKAGKFTDAVNAAGRAMKLGYPGKFGEYAAGQAEEGAGNNEAALSCYDRAINFGLSSPEVFLSKAKLLKKMNRVDRAREEVQSLESMFLGNMHVEDECLEFYYGESMHQQCIDAAERAIRSDRTNEHAWRRRGLSLLALKRYDESIVSLEAALKLKRDSETISGLKEAYNAKGDKRSIIRAIDMLLEFRGGEKALLLEKGDVLAESGRHEEALNTYQSAMDRFGLDEDAVVRKGGILHAQGRYQDELEILLEFSKGDGTRPAIQAMIARAYLCMKRYSDALDYADRAMTSDPGNVKHLDLRAGILRALGRDEEAERSVDIALGIAPKDPEALEIKADLLLAWKKHSQALELLNGALSAGICNPSIYRKRGDSLLNLERYAEALDSYTKAQKDDPSGSAALLGKGICELHLGRYSSATLSLNEYTKKEPESGKGWYYFGLALKNQKIYSEARRAFSHAVELNDELDRAWLELGEMQMSSGEIDEAQKAFEKALEHAPHSAEAVEALRSCRAEMRKREAEENAIRLLKLEYDLARNPTKEEAFSRLHIPMDEIDPAFDLLNEPTTLPIPARGEDGWSAVEERSAMVLAKCFRNEETASYGVRLCDIAHNFPSFTLDEAKQIFEYIAKVQKLNVIDAMDDERFERLMKKATRLKKGERSLRGIIASLNVGIYTAKLIEGSLASMGKTGYTTDFVSFSGEEAEPEEEKQSYNPYEVRRQLYEQYYGGDSPAAAEVEEESDRCLYHGSEAIGSCSSCQTNICNVCLSATEGHCPNCGVVLLNEGAGGEAAF